EQARAAVGHGLQLFVLAVAASSAGPLELERLEFLAQFDGPVLTNVKGIVVEEDFLELREILQGVFHFLDDVVDRASAPRVARDGLWPHTEGAHRRATAGGIERNEGMEQEWDVVVFDGEIALVDIGGERQRIELGGVQLRTLGVVHDLAILAIADAE